MTLFLAGSLAAAQTGTTKGKSKTSKADTTSTSDKKSSDKSSMSNDKSGAGAQIDINTASKDELVKDLPGVGDVTADKIIAGRPYANKSQLVSRKIVSEKVYAKISPRIIGKQGAGATKAGGGSSDSMKPDAGSSSDTSKGKKKKKGK